MTRIFNASGEEDYIMSTFDAGIAHEQTSILFKQGDFYLQAIDNMGSSNIRPRTGNGCYRLPQTAYIHKTLPTTQAELYGGFGILTPAAVSGDCAIFYLGYSVSDLAGSNKIGLGANGTIYGTKNDTVVSRSATSTIQASTWHYVEYHINAIQSGTFTLKVDGTTVINYSGDMRFSGATQISWIALRGGYYFTFFDDMCLNDINGTVNNSWPGQVRMMPLKFNQEGTHIGLTRVGTDLGTNISNFNNRGGVDYSAVQASAADQYDLYRVAQPVLPANAAITNVIVQMNGRVYNGSGGGCWTVKKDSTVADGSTVALTAAWKKIEYVMPTQADGSAWTAAGLAAHEFGPKGK